MEDEVRKELEKIKTDAEKIEFILKKFYEFYKNDNELDENYIGKLGRTKEFLDIKTLIENLDRVRNIPVFIRKIQND